MKYRIRVIIIALSAISALAFFNMTADADPYTEPSSTEEIEKPDEESLKEKQEEETNRLLDEILKDGELQNTIDDVFGTRDSVKGSVSSLINGEKTAFEMWKELSGIDRLSPDTYKGLLIKLIILGVMCAIISLLPQILGSEQTSQLAGFICFVCLIGFVFSTFYDALIVLKTAIEGVIVIITALMPVYLTAVAMSGGVTTAVLYQEVYLAAMYGMQHFLLGIVCPAVVVYLCLSAANMLTEEDKLSKLCNLIYSAVNYILKAAAGIILAFHVFQGLITPFVDRFQTSVLKRGLEIIPGIGDLAGSGVEIAYGIALLLKNSIGVMGMVILAAAAAIPFVSLCGYALVFMIGGAVMQPVIPVKAGRLMEAAALAMKLMVKILLITVLIFIISIAMLAIGSGGGL